MKDSLQQALIRIDRLQQQYDSLAKSRALDEAKYRALEQHDIITHVNDYYDHSWNSLLWIIGFLLGVFGLILPIINTLINNRNQRNSLKDLSETISSQLTEAFETRLRQLTESNILQFERLEAELDAHKDNLENYVRDIKSENRIQLNSYAFLLLGLRSDSLAISYYNYCLALHNWIEVKDLNNIEVCLKLLNNLIDQLPIQDFRTQEDILNNHHIENASLANSLELLDKFSFDEKLKFNFTLNQLKSKYLKKNE